MDMGVRVVKRPLYTAHVGAGAFLWKTGKRHGKWRFHNVSTGLVYRTSQSVVPHNHFSQQEYKPLHQ
jgi:hypothetical protein